MWKPNDAPIWERAGSTADTVDEAAAAVARIDALTMAGAQEWAD
ncbi:MAG TPA: hypothetical protein VGN81_31700 [Pseudonocardiaceae bacterium]